MGKKFNLFDTLVSSALQFDGEIFGINPCDDPDLIRTKFL